MNSRTTADFWQAFYRLPQFVQARAVIAYRKWQRNPHQRGLFLSKSKGDTRPFTRCGSDVDGGLWAIKPTGPLSSGFGLAHMLTMTVFFQDTDRMAS